MSEHAIVSDEEEGGELSFCRGIEHENPYFCFGDYPFIEYGIVFLFQRAINF
ncbi:MAG: hypothetical protein JXD23_00525 [Spirochaetales bacterium]|nr:hypothetical protein [Spirochaetales bacterium]